MAETAPTADPRNTRHGTHGTEDTARKIRHHTARKTQHRRHGTEDTARKTRHGRHGTEDTAPTKHGTEDTAPTTRYETHGTDDTARNSGPHAEPTAPRRHHGTHGGTHRQRNPWRLTARTGRCIVSTRYWRFQWRSVTKSSRPRPRVLWWSPRSRPMWPPSRRQRMGSASRMRSTRPERPYRPAGSSDPRDRGPHVAKGFGKRDRRLVYVTLPGGSAGGQFSSEMNGVGIVVLDVDRNFEFVKRIPTWNVPASIESGGSLGGRREPGHQHDLSGDARPARGLRPGYRPKGLGEHL